ncbi:GNAT family N-acetyltransferase [Fonticella tunisiensis]|uniref:N-acetyltransferase domain-containing protein n=1 Tax=Fonticella tunisiensis TaxID=1096341 RepID=A0A4R7KQI9_9CLOT|nr:GNAT family N-acetyltransferase [Fonticella tunisiensis]TDT60966.1 hypothetical protein EDD71_11084 [Fonticella tunisiensis]
MMRILNDDDREKVMEYLERNHIETTFLIGNVTEFGLENDNEKRRCGDYYGYFEDGKLKGVLPFYNLGSCIPHYESEGAVDAFSKIMKERRFETLLGMERIVKPLYERIKDYKIIHTCSDDSYFINKRFKPFYVEGAVFKDALDYDIDKVVEFIITANKNGFGREMDREMAIKQLTQRGKEEDFIFLIKNGRIVAQANIQAYTSKINQIGGVFTLEEERSKGYCKAIVSELCRRIVARGKVPTLMVRKNNTPAVRAYKALGFDFYDDYLIIEFL